MSTQLVETLVREAKERLRVSIEANTAWQLKKFKEAGRKYYFSTGDICWYTNTGVRYWPEQLRVHHDSVRDLSTLYALGQGGGGPIKWLSGLVTGAGGSGGSPSEMHDVLGRI